MKTDEIKAEILRFYQNLYTENEQWRPTATFEGLASITSVEKVWLERPFEEEEVLAAINSCAPDKSPVPDGFTMAFYQKAWAVIKSDIMGALTHFYQHCYIVRSCNASFIALVPKKKGAIELRDFRPTKLEVSTKLLPKF